MTEDAGVIYCTSGEKYFNDAVVSARSFKSLHPEKKIAIFTEEDYLRHEIFDFHFPIFQSQGEVDWVAKYYSKQPKKWMLKVICTPRSPFAKTVHLDSDTLVIQRIDPLFDDLDRNDIILTHLDWVKQENGVNTGLYGLRVANGINSGVYAYRNSPGALRVLGSQWRKECEAEGFVRNEQSILSKFVKDPEKYLYDVKWKIEDNVVYNATRRMWRTMSVYGLWDDARILHFNETEKLKKVFEQQMNRDDLLKLPRVQECTTEILKVRPERDPERLVHFHLAKTAGKSLLAAMRDHLGDAAVSFNPSQQEAFRTRIRGEKWKVISGHLSGAHGPIRNRLRRRYEFFTVLRDPIDRFYSAYNYIRKTPMSGLHDLFNTMSPVDAARYSVENSLDFGRNSQCSGIIWSSDIPATADNARAAINDRYAFVCTLEQMDELGTFLSERGLISGPRAIPHINKTAIMDSRIYADLTEVLGISTKEDMALYQYTKANGPLRKVIGMDGISSPEN